MTFDEVIKHFENEKITKIDYDYGIEDENGNILTEEFLEYYDVNYIVDELREEYAPTVEMTEE